MLQGWKVEEDREMLLDLATLRLLVIKSRSFQLGNG